METKWIPNGGKTGTTIETILKTTCPRLRGKMETTWRLNGDNVDAYWRQHGNTNGGTPWRQTWRQQWRQTETKWKQNVHFYEVKWRQHIDTMETKMETTLRRNGDQHGDNMGTKWRQH